MSSKFGFLSKLNFLQDFVSSLIARVNPAIVHNIEKYIAIKKVHYLSAIEDIEGDYIEFGVFTGSSFCHSIRCVKNLANINSKILSTKFYGFDSFEGFGELIEEDNHPFYKDTNFEASYDKVNNRVKRVAKGIDYRLIEGFFSETLKQGAKSYDIEKTRIIFIDSDTYSSAIDALLFALPTVQEGTYIILDDYFSYRGSLKHGVAKAFQEFSEKGHLTHRRVLDYGMGGAVFIISEI